MKRNTVRALLAAGAVLPLMSYVFFSGSPRWPLSGGFHYVVDLNTTSFPAGSVWDNNAQYSLSDWRDMGSTGFLAGYTRTNSDFNDHGNGRNSWVWLNRPSDGWLGITFVRWSGSTMVDCDIWYNSRPDYLWTNGLTDPSASRPYWPIEFRNVARHEAGHAIGLDHENRTLAQMNSISQHGAGVPHTTATGMLPHADDKAGCRVLYPGSGTTWNVMSTSWREPDQVSNNGARKLTLSGSYAAGAVVSMPVWLTNQSNATVPGQAAGIRVGIYLSTNDIISTGDTRIAEYTFTGDWGPHVGGYYTLGGTIPSSMPAGSYYVGAIFDNTGVVAERYETDNDSYVGPITVTNTAYTVSVQSQNPSSGVPITVSLTDNNGNKDGTTSFSRTYWRTTLVGLTAPTSFNGVPFKRWVLNGVNQTLGDNTLDVTMNANATATAVYYQRTVGSFTTYGTSCQGTTGLSSHTGAAPKGYPFAGDPWTLRLTNARANTGAVLYVGLSNTSWGAFPLPLNLAFVGIPNCFLRASVDINLGTSTNASGQAALTFPTPPNSASLIGASLYSQFAYIDIGAPYATPVPHSNGLRSLFGGDL